LAYALGVSAVLRRYSAMPFTDLYLEPIDAFCFFEEAENKVVGEVGRRRKMG
jgi:hypothetical protein